MKKLTKRIIAATLAAVTLTPQFASYTLPVSAASLVEYNNEKGTINIDERLIGVTRTKYISSNKPNTLDSELDLEFGEISYDHYVHCDKLDRINIKFTISCPSLNDRNKYDLYSKKLTVDYYNNKFCCSTQSYTPTNVSLKDNGVCTIEYEIITLGDSFTFYTQNLGLNNFSLLKTEYTPHAKKYWKIEVYAPNGENLIISLRDDVNMRVQDIDAWAKRLCVYANSLSEVTKIKRDTIFIVTDDPYETSYNSNYKVKNYGYVGFYKGHTDWIRDSIASEKNELLWVELHELAHAYGSSNTSESIFNSSFGLDDYYNNIRGLTAIQNCENLKNVTINYEGVKGDYLHVLKNKSPKTNDPMIYFPYKLVELADTYTYGWNTLEKFLSIAEPYDFNSNDNIKAAKIIEKMSGVNIPSSGTKRNDYLRFVNSLRAIYEIHTAEKFADDEYKFKKFVKDYFGEEFIKYAFLDLTKNK